MRARAPSLIAALLGPLLVGAGCGSSSLGPNNGVPDLGVWQPPSDLGGCAGLFAQVVFQKCPSPSPSSDGGLPRCTGAAPLEVRLVPLTPPGITDVLWSLSDGGAPPTSVNVSPSVDYAMPGLYGVRLVVTGANCGQASAKAEISVTTIPTGGGPCSVDAQCGGGNACLCPDGVSAADGGAGCPGELARGLCTRFCTGGACDANEACVDLSRTTWNAPELVGQPFRHPLCLPTCTTDAECSRLHAGFTCRELPALELGAVAGGPISWRKACFGKTAWEDGHSCADANGKPSPGDCVGGLCLPIGARNLCSSPCATDPCPSTAACATFNYDPAHPVCIPRCDVKTPCADPLLECREPDLQGWFGFSLAKGQPMEGTYCVPRRCNSEVECTPAGHCQPSPGGGPDAGSRTDAGLPVSFCVP